MGKRTDTDCNTTLQPDFVEVASTQSLPPGTMLKVSAHGVDIALVNVDGRVRAFSDPCLRCGNSLAAGRLDRGLIPCGQCGWQYDASNGALVGLPALRMERYAVHVDSDRIFVADHADATPQGEPEGRSKAKADTGMRAAGASERVAD